MIDANEALRRTNLARIAIGNKFADDHPDVLEKIQLLIDNNQNYTYVYYENSGAKPVSAVDLGIYLMTKGYGVRLATPGMPNSGLYISWSRSQWKPDMDEYTWMDPESLL